MLQTRVEYRICCTSSRPSCMVTCREDTSRGKLPVLCAGLSPAAPSAPRSSNVRVSASNRPTAGFVSLHRITPNQRGQQSDAVHHSLPNHRQICPGRSRPRDFLSTWYRLAFVLVEILAWDSAGWAEFDVTDIGDAWEQLWLYGTICSHVTRWGLEQRTKASCSLHIGISNTPGVVPCPRSGSTTTGALVKRQVGEGAKAMQWAENSQIGGKA